VKNISKHWKITLSIIDMAVSTSAEISEQTASHIDEINSKFERFTI